MKVAFCLFGQARYLEKSAYDVIRNSNGVDSVDVYIHCWWDGGLYKAVNSGASDLTVQNNTIDQIKEMYNPLKILTEPQKQFEDYSNVKVAGPVGGPPLNRVSQFYSMEQSYRLIDNPTDYDWIVITRFDVKFRTYITKIDFERMKQDRTYSAYLHYNSLPCSLLEFCPGVLAEKYFGHLFTDIREIGLTTAERYLRAVLDKYNLVCEEVPLCTIFDHESIVLYHSIYISNREGNNHYGLSPPYDVF